MSENSRLIADRLPGGFAVLLLAFTALGIVVAADYLTSYELSLSAFYVLIILAVSWFCGVWWGGLFTFLSIFSEIQIGLLTGTTFSEQAYFYVSNGNRLFSYLLIAYLTAMVRTLYERAQSAARVDFVTGVTNSTGFYEKVAVEMARHRRDGASFAVAYISCDYFKIINDGLGHSEGDRVLLAVGQTLRMNLRETDVVARLGGDEFGLIFPRTGEAEVLPLIRKLCENLDRAMAEHDWPITFSVGVGVFPKVPESADRVITFCDRLMQRVKALGKNKILHKVYDPDDVETPPARLRAVR
jgi:diguanylate cyclase (GGDEF)-like protein